MRSKELLPHAREKAEKYVKVVAAALAVLVICLFAVSAMAVPPGKTVEFPDGAMGKVIFDGKVHADKGLKCNDCHTKIFPMKKGGTIAMADINAGKFCGACHNGTRAFAAKDAANCTRCHKK
ncbi:MAG: cytochrome c3 family protein [Nitrospirae bacterium]|nr:cytochrome c3 family protein [Nitrospirota bacterium]